MYTERTQSLIGQKCHPDLSCCEIHLVNDILVNKVSSPLLVLGSMLIVIGVYVCDHLNTVDLPLLLRALTFSPQSALKKLSNSVQHH